MLGKKKKKKKNCEFLVCSLAMISILHLLSSLFKCEKAVVCRTPFLKLTLESESEAGFSLAHTSPTKILKSNSC